MEMLLISLIVLSVSAIAGSILRLHYLRAKIAMEILDDIQFNHLQQHGMAGSWLNDPTRMIFELRYVRDVLKSSESPKYVKLLSRWNWCIQFLLVGTILFALISIALVLFGR